MWSILKVFIEFVTTLLPCFGFLPMRYVGSWLLDPGIKLVPPALENKVLATGPPGKSPSYPSAGVWMWRLSFAQLVKTMP